MALCGCYLSAAAADRFLIHFKLNEERRAVLRRSHPKAGAREHEVLVTKELKKKLHTEQLAALSAAATKAKGQKIEITDLRLVGGRGTHVILLSEDLDENQTEQFLKEVESMEQVESIEVSTRVQAF